jgi:RNA polymerase sigma-70 factor, ECF subfamily
VSSLSEKAVDTSDLQARSDQELVRICLSGEVDAYGVLVRRYQGRVFGYLVRLTRQRELAEELAQEAFFHAYTKLDTCRQPDRYLVWVLKIGRNLAINSMRRGQFQTVPLTGVADDAYLVDTRTLEEGGPEGTVEAQELAVELEKRVMSLPPKYRETVVLRHVGGRSYDEIAAVLDIPLGTVKFRLHRAYRLLKERLFKG